MLRSCWKAFGHQPKGNRSPDPATSDEEEIRIIMAEHSGNKYTLEIEIPEFKELLKNLKNKIAIEKSSDG